MKLALDLTDMESDSREGLQGDLTDMERMLAAYLNLQGDGQETDQCWSHSAEMSACALNGKFTLSLSIARTKYDPAEAMQRC